MKQKIFYSAALQKHFAADLSERKITRYFKAGQTVCAFFLHLPAYQHRALARHQSAPR
jgi:hypothetical protein